MLIFLASPSMLIFKDVYASTVGKRGQKYVFSSKDLVNLVFSGCVSTNYVWDCSPDGERG